MAKNISDMKITNNGDKLMYAMISLAQILLLFDHVNTMIDRFLV